MVDRKGNQGVMRHPSFLLSRQWFWLALIAMMLLLAACPSGGKSGY